jgi:hypothetical protein
MNECLHRVPSHVFSQRLVLLLKLPVLAARHVPYLIGRPALYLII